MLFNSFQFFLFFPIVTIIYFLLPHKLRWSHLLVASCIFYMAFIPAYILILIVTIIIDYIAGIMIENEAGTKRKKWFLVMSIIANVGVLAIFKYYNFFVFNIDHLLHFAHSKTNIPLLNIILPIGLSFHTFQAMSYTIEVYRGNQKAERHFGIYALYVMFYPQLVAGPIERPQNLLHQFYEKHEFSYENVIGGLRQMMWGLFKKAVIADRLALLVDPVYDNPHHASSLSLVIATIFFAYQIYCDFSGYSDIALGAAKVMGFHLMLNFNRPYRARSISEFWRRWHISLFTWFSDYIYIPLATSLRDWGKFAVGFSVIVIFLISGLWHGAAWKYIAWGALHGIAMAYEVFTKKTRKKIFKSIPTALGNFISVVCTFSYVCFTYIFFRASSLQTALAIVKKIFHIFSEVSGFKYLYNSIAANITGFLLIIMLELIYLIEKGADFNSFVVKQPRVARWAIYYTIGMSIYLFGVYQNRQFIYFKF